MILLITYDLHKADRDYPAVERVIKAEGNWAHIEESVWLIDTLTPCVQWRDDLQSAAPEATCFLVHLQRDWSSSGVNQELVDWLNDARRRW